MSKEEKWFNAFVSMFQRGILQEEHMDLVAQGDTKKRMEELVTRLRSAKSARSAAVLGKRDREMAELPEGEASQP